MPPNSTDLASDTLVQATDVSPVVASPGMAGGAGSTGSQGMRHGYLFWPAFVYVAARGLTLLGLTISNVFTHHDSLYGELHRWDGVWFLRAATQGYPSRLPMLHGHVAGNTTAFFPAFPLAVRWLSYLTMASPLGVGLAISGVTGLTAVIAIGVLTREFAGAEKATRAAVLFAVLPGTFAFSLPYSEGIVITCVAFGLLALLRRRWWLAGVLGLVVTAASPIGLAFVLGCGWCSVRAIMRDRDWRSLPAPVLAPLGFVAYMLYLWAHTGNLSAWRLTERGGWESYPSAVYPFHVIASFVFDPVRPTMTGQILFAGTVVTVVAAIFAIRERQPAPVLLYGLAAAAMSAISAPVGLRPRFIMLAFPLVIAAGTRLHGRTYRCVLVLSACGLVAMTFLEMFSVAVFP